MSRVDLLPGLGAQPGHLFWRASARVTAMLPTALPPGVDLHAYAVLLVLADGSTRSQQDLADLLVLSRTTLARVAADLARRGLVERVRNPADRRQYALTRTADGAHEADAWGAYADDVEQRLLATLGDDDAARFARHLVAVASPDLVTSLPARLAGSCPFLITRIHAALHRDFLAALEPLDVEPRDFGTLTALTEAGELTQAQLARALGVSGPTVVEIVDRLEERALVRRRRAPEDRRTHLLEVTDTGVSTLRAAEPVARALTVERMAALSPSGCDDLLDLLRRFVLA